MFTGIIEGLGTIKRLSMKGTDAVLEIEAGIEMADVRLGDSIAVNGACLTVTAKNQNIFHADVSAGREIWSEMVRSGGGPAEKYVESLGLKQESGSDALEKWAEEAIAGNPGEVARYKAGKTQLLGFFVGQVMKKSAGKANPKLTGEIVRKKLEG